MQRLKSLLPGTNLCSLQVLTNGVRRRGQQLSDLYQRVNGQQVIKLRVGNRLPTR